MLLQRPLRGEACRLSGCPSPVLAGAYPRAAVATSSFESCLPPVDTRLRATHSAAAAPADGGRRFVLLLQHVFFVFFLLRFDP